MTTDERNKIEARLKIHDNAVARARYLKEAIESIKRNDCNFLLLPLSKVQNGNIQWAAHAPSDRLWHFQNVCWSAKEKDLIADIEKAVLAILAKRLAEATKETEEA